MRWVREPNKLHEVWRHFVAFKVSLWASKAFCRLQRCIVDFEGISWTSKMFVGCLLFWRCSRVRGERDRGVVGKQVRMFLFPSWCQSYHCIYLHLVPFTSSNRRHVLELRYCCQDHKVKGGLERALLEVGLIRKAQYVLPRLLSTRYLRCHLSIEYEIQFTAKGFLVLLSCGPETITKV